METPLQLLHARGLWQLRIGAIAERPQRGTSPNTSRSKSRNERLPRKREAKESRSTKTKLASIAGRMARVKKTGKPHQAPSQKRVEAGRKASRKGGGYERHCAKLFKAWGGGTVARVPRSGGWHAGAEFDAKGDLIFKPSSRYHVECKNRKSWRLDDLITGVRAKGSNSIEAWWEQTVRDCPRGKLPLLIFTKANQPDWLMTTVAVLHEHDLTGWYDFIPHFRVYNDQGERVIMKLLDFMAYCPPLKPSPNRKKWTRGFNAKGAE